MECQPYPVAGQLASGMNLGLAQLKSKIRDEQVVYCYVVASIKNLDGQFSQTGSGPNFQGDLVTLCTCKRFMRTFMDAKDWVGKWIAGFSGVAAGNGKNVLVYLMKVRQAFESYQCLWLSDKIPEEAKQAKLAHVNTLGDIYQPVSRQISNPFAAQNYIHPVEYHTHAKDNEWHKDINYQCANRPRLRWSAIRIIAFFGDKPMIAYEGCLYRPEKDISSNID
jgi:hypothetical protein